jgi:hypothetical protein
LALAKRKEKSLKIKKKILLNKKGQLLKNFPHQIQRTTLNNATSLNSTKTSFSVKKEKRTTKFPLINSSKKNSWLFKKSTPIKETSAAESLTEKLHQLSKLGKNKSKLSKTSIKSLELGLK